MVLTLPFHQPSLLPNKLRRYPLLTNPRHPPSSSRITKHRQFCPLISSQRSNLEVSWIQTEGSSSDDFGGWFVCRKPEIEARSGGQKIVFVGIGASMAVMIAAFACFSFSKKVFQVMWLRPYNNKLWDEKGAKLPDWYSTLAFFPTWYLFLLRRQYGFKFRFDAPLRSFHQLLTPSESRRTPVEFKESTALEVDHASETEFNDTSAIGSDALKSEMESDFSGNKRIIVPLAADPIQQEALDVLKKLKIIETDASADELCTRREYARWFVKANSMLERNPKYKIVPLMLVTGSTATAFDDVSSNDPDFWCIQALGEAGVVLSKLSAVDSSKSNVGSSGGQERFNFYPESFISRFDLINWKVMVEYPFTSEVKEEMLRMKVGLLDLSASSLDASPQLLMDLMAGDKSTLRRVFGNIRRLQPQKPVTKAQAAVALISGRMTEIIRSEISRREAENQAKLAEMEEIRSDLIRRGEIQSTWEEKLNKEKEREIEFQRDFQTALVELEKEKTARDEGLAEYMKEKVALDYQQQLLLSLRKEVDDMNDRLSTEKANLSEEQQSLEKLFADLHDQQDAVIEAKSILEAEKEALRILRYWVEEEALKIRDRSKILEQAAQRWKWTSSSGKLA